MGKTSAIIKMAAVRNLSYRFTVVTYRVGEFIEMIVLVMMWSAIYSNSPLIGGYSLRQMLTYILIGNIVEILTRNYLSDVVARDIKDGGLTIWLLKPMHYFRYIMVHEIGRISLTFGMSCIVQVLLILLFIKQLLPPVNAYAIIIVIAMVILAFIVELLISFLIGLVAFWTSEVGGLYMTISRLKRFLAGNYFPLNLLPVVFVNVSLLFPFSYSFFVPTQLYLGKLDLATGLKGIGIQMVWIALLYGIIHLVWKRGLKRYEGVGI